MKMKFVKGMILGIFGLFFLAGCQPKTVPDSTPDEQLTEAYQRLTLQETAESDLTLPTSDGNVTITWKSNNEEVLSSLGKVHRPDWDSEDIDVLLTATLSLDTKQVQKEFSVLVLKEEATISKINHTDSYVYRISEESASSYPYYKGYTYAGLINKDGTPHTEFKENKTTGKRISVMLFGAKADDENFDNVSAFQNAIDSCSAGDEVYVPEGKYYFSGVTQTTPYYAHLVLKEGVNLVGDGPDKSVLISNFKNGEYVNSKNGKKTATLVCNSSDCTISYLGFSANTDDACLPPTLSTTQNNPAGNAHAPAFGIVIYNLSKLHLVQNNYIHHVFVEYFQYDGIRLYCTKNCKIANCTITKATDLGGGGAGYGIELRGGGHEYFDYIDTKADSCYNIVENNTIIGPYIRHGIILSYLTHNNLFYQNNISDTQDDSYDVHGQDEFLNVFSQNYAKGARSAGIGLGNTGSSHDESGYGNVLYQNTLESCGYGVTVSRGTQWTQIILNRILRCTKGIEIKDGPNTHQEGNTFET